MVSANYHTHNRWCKHASGEIEDYVKVAIERGLEVLAITDHVPHKDNLDARRIQWEEFEAYKTPEAKFAHTLDNFQPLMLNNSTGGRSWKEHGVKLSQILKRNEKTCEGSEVIWEYASGIIKENIERGTIIKDK